MIDPLTLDQMRVLVAVADEGSFSAASRALGRVQSAISQSIQTLETTLGVSLFDRSYKTPRLTDAGRAIVDDARGADRRGGRAARSRPKHRRGCRAGADAGGRRDLSDAAADGEPEGVPQRVPSGARDFVHRGPRGRRAATARRRGATGDLHGPADPPERPLRRVHDPNCPVAGGRRRSPAGEAARTADARSRSSRMCSSC